MYLVHNARFPFSDEPPDTCSRPKTYTAQGQRRNDLLFVFGYNTNNINDIQPKMCLHLALLYLARILHMIPGKGADAAARQNHLKGGIKTMRKWHTGVYIPLILLVLCMTFRLFAQDSQEDTESRTGQTLLFGPQRYEIIDQSPAFFSDSFEVTKPGQCHLLVLNGVERNPVQPEVLLGNRVTSGSIAINGRLVVTPRELNIQKPVVQKPIMLAPGAKTIDTVIHGNPGSFITVALWQEPPPEPVFCAGKLVLPYGTIQGDNQMALYIHNNNFRHPRQCRLLFFKPDGAPGGMSELLTVPPNGVLKLRPGAVNTIRPSWVEGSIDIIWMGFGRIDLNGYAVQIDPSGRKTVLPLISYPIPCGEDIG